MILGSALKTQRKTNFRAKTPRRKERTELSLCFVSGVLCELCGFARDAFAFDLKLYFIYDPGGKRI
jgi:hypothetical protein